MGTPTLDKMLEIQEQSELCGDFLDFLLHKYTLFERKQKRETAFVNADGAGDYINKERDCWLSSLELSWRKLRGKGSSY